VRKLLEATSHGGPARCLYLAPVSLQAKRIAWDDLKALVHPMYLAKPPAESDLTLTTIWGSQLVVGGFDRPQRFEGLPWDMVVVDESSDIKPKAVDLSIRPAVADTGGSIYRIGVPKRTGIGAKEFRQICEDRSKGYTFFEWSAETVLPEAELALLRDTYDSKDYDEQIRGLVVESSGLAYHQFVAKHYPEGNLLASPATQYNPSHRIVVGSDFNVNPMAWVLAHVFDGRVHIFDEIWLRDTNTRSTLNELYRRYPEHKAGWLFLGDATGQNRHTSASAASQSDYQVIMSDTRFAGHNGVSCKYPSQNPRVKDRLASVNALLCSASGTRRLVISPTCTHLIEDLDSRQLKTTGDPINADADSGHITDALGYLVHALFPVHALSMGLDVIDYDNPNAGIEYVPLDIDPYKPEFGIYVPEF
jgi:hypothetical protein